MCPACYQDGGSLLHCLSTLTSASEAVYFCCTGLGVTSTGRYPASCPLKPGLSSSAPFRLYSRDHLTCLHECYSNTNIFLSKEKNHQDFYTSKQLPPTNSLNSELCASRSKIRAYIRWAFSSLFSFLRYARPLHKVRLFPSPQFSILPQKFCRQPPVASRY